MHVHAGALEFLYPFFCSFMRAVDGYDCVCFRHFFLIDKSTGRAKAHSSFKTSQRGDAFGEKEFRWPDHCRSLDRVWSFDICETDVDCFQLIRLQNVFSVFTASFRKPQRRLKSGCRATARLWSFYIFEARSGSSDGFRQQ
jgi:hypothetical protein